MPCSFWGLLIIFSVGIYIENVYQVFVRIRLEF